MKPSNEIVCLFLMMLVIFVAAAENEERLSYGMTVQRETRGRIVGGDDAKPKEFPSFVNAIVCGGTLIRPDIVLTAAHCADDIMKEGFVFVPGYKLKGGGQKIAVDKVVPHKKWDEVKLINDIAIVVLKKCAKNPVLQRLNTDPKVPADDAPVTVIGLGQLSGVVQKYPKVLQKVKVSVIGSKKCSKWWKGGSKIFKDIQICAGTVKGARDACLGDSGGPLLIDGPKVKPASSPSCTPSTTPSHVSSYFPVDYTSSAPYKLPIPAPVKRPVSAPIKRPVLAPIKRPVSAPSSRPDPAPYTPPVSSQYPFTGPTSLPLIPVKIPSPSVATWPYNPPVPAPVRSPSAVPWTGNTPSPSPVPYQWPSYMMPAPYWLDKSISPAMTIVEPNSTVDGNQDRRRAQRAQVVTYTDTIEVGIVSYVAVCALPELPTVYTRVSKYINFIEDNIKAHSKCKIKEKASC